MTRTQSQMFEQILSVFGDENSPYYTEDIAEMCRKKIASSKKSNDKTAKKLEVVRQYIKRFIDEDDPVSSKDLAAIIMSETEERWTPQGAGYYLRKLVADGAVREIGKSPKTYIWIGEC